MTIDTLVTENMKLVPFVVRKYFKWSRNFEELCSIGNIGLVRAAKNFDPDKNIKFSTYAARCIHSEIARAMRESTRQKRVNTDGFVYLDTMHMGEEHGEVPTHEVVSAETTEIADSEDRLYVEHLLSLLNVKEKRIFTMHFGLNGSAPMSGEVIGKRLGYTRSNINLIIRKAMKRIRETEGAVI